MTSGIMVWINQLYWEITFDIVILLTLLSKASSVRTLLFVNACNIHNDITQIIRQIL